MTFPPMECKADQSYIIAEHFFQPYCIHNSKYPRTGQYKGARYPAPFTLLPYRSEYIQIEFLAQFICSVTQYLVMMDYLICMIIN